MNHIDIVAGIVVTARRRIGDLRSSGAALREALRGPLLDPSEATTVALALGNLYSDLDRFESVLVGFDQSVRAGIPVSELAPVIAADAVPSTVIADAQPACSSSVFITAALRATVGPGESVDGPESTIVDRALP